MPLKKSRRVKSRRRRVKSRKITTICKTYIRIPIRTQNVLKKLITDTDKNGKYKEYGGAFIGRPPKVYEKDTLEIFCSDHISEGGKSSASVPKSILNFHTHHTKHYHVEKVDFAWPSPSDYKAIKSKMLDKSDKTRMHLVTTREGLYVISLSKYAIAKGNKSLKNWRINKFCHELGKDNEWYLNRINKIRNPVFNVEFKPWGMLSEEKFTIIYPSCDKGNCNFFSGEKCIKSDW